MEEYVGTTIRIPFPHVEHLPTPGTKYPYGRPLIGEQTSRAERLLDLHTKAKTFDPETDIPSS